MRFISIQVEHKVHHLRTPIDGKENEPSGNNKEIDESGKMMARNT